MFKSFTAKYNTRNSSQSSLAPLNSFTSKQDPERVFGELASTYGLNSTVPSLPSLSSSFSTKSSSTQSRRQSSTTPTMVLPSSPTKNYEQSYAELVSTYGFGAGVPCLPPTQKKLKSSSKKSTPSTLSPKPSSHGAHPPSSQKNYELAFGELSSTYGFGGAVPSLPKSN